MAAPNIVNVASILGKTTTLIVTTTPQTLINNAGSSNKVFKVNSLIVSNVNGTAAADVTVDHYRGATATRLAFSVSVPAKSTLVVLSKDTSIYLEEGDSIRMTASVNSYLEGVASYEEVS